MITLAIVLLLIYVLCVSSLIYGNHKLSQTSNVLPTKEVLVTILIPFRNEEGNLKKLAESLSRQTYFKEKLEVVFINDHSTDLGMDYLRNWTEEFPFAVQLIDNDGEGKKAAIKKGVSHSNGELILTTDADCVHSEDWVRTMVSYYQYSKANLLIGPVSMSKTYGFDFQKVEFSTLIASSSGAAGIGKAFACNGANLGFKKSIFNQLNPFESNIKIASGDDVFFLHKIKEKLKSPKISFVADSSAIVTTKGSSSLLEFINQRVRWARKSFYFNDRDSLVFGSVLFLTNCTIILLFILRSWELFMLFFIIKYLVDSLLLFSARRWIGLKNLFFNSFFLSLLYPLYFLVFALLSLLYQPQWKGRKV